ncbi:MAG TPA: hypothetical protein VNJ08_05495 [Bacteriovoracaceae bacterium]|nr:hypothetical protein [Bacteriovoracaceae bacterium]
MKKNLILFGVLIALLTAVYFLQEKRVEREYNDQLTKGKLIQGEITQLKLPAVSAVKKEGQWWSGDQLLSHNTFKQIEKKLSEITTFKDIEGDPKNFMSNAINIEVNGEPWLLGDLTLDKQAFYVSKSGKISLAFIDGPSGGTSSSEEEVGAGKVNEVKQLLLTTLPELKETQLFRFYPNLPIERVKLHAEGISHYELLIKENTTLPPPIKGVLPQADLQNKLMSVVTQIFLKEEILYNENLKYKKLATMKFSATGSKDVTWQVWLRSKDSADSVLIDDDNKRAFLMKGGSLKPFFLHVQDFWDKKVIPANAFKGFDRLPVTLTQGSKQALVHVLDREPLEFDVKNYKVKPGNMQDLMQFLLNLGERDQAHRVSQLTTTDKKQYISENRLRIDVMGQELICLRKKDELIVANLTQGFKAHFMLPFEKLNCQFEDVLE